jgi:dihydrofolate reductase
MREVSFFIAASLDGYIAGPNGETGWLFSDADYGYTPFLDSIDTLLMGRKTFEVLLTFGEYPYPEKRVLVFSRTVKTSPIKGVEMAAGDVSAVVQSLKSEAGKKIWLVGGFDLAGQLLKADLVDEMVLSLHPVLLGGGIPLFPKLEKPLQWHTQKSESFQSGLVQITLKRAR